jgi:hypothetical protein
MYFKNSCNHESFFFFYGKLSVENINITIINLFLEI